MLEKQGIRRKVTPIQPVARIAKSHNRRRPREYQQKFRLLPGGKLAESEDKQS